MNRDEHLAWCKKRALEYVDAGDLNQAFTSMASDLGKHPELAASARLAGDLGLPLLLGGHLSSVAEMRRWIDGFN